MERVAPLTPIVSCNIDATLEPTMQPLFTKSTILNRNGTQIGIVGVTTTSKSNWGRANVLPEVENVRKEVEKLTEEGIKIIVVLSHCGLDTDREIAKFGGWFCGLKFHNFKFKIFRTDRYYRWWSFSLFSVLWL